MTLCVLRRENKLLLGMKKRGFGVGKYNGFGGKVQNGETIEKCTAREVREEAGIVADTLHKTAELTFHFAHKPDWDCTVHVFLCTQWSGDAIESDEMKPEWFFVSHLPFERMWPDDKYWLPHVLDGKFVTATFTFGENDMVLEHNLTTRPL